MNEQEKFLEDLEIKDDSVLDKPIIEESPVEEEDDGLKAKNRRERRLLTQNQRLREEAIAVNVRLDTLQESQKLRETESEKEYLKRLERIFGTDTPEKVEATNLLKEAFLGLKDEVKQETLTDWEGKQSQETQAVRDEGRNLDEIGDYVQDEYGLNDSDMRGYYSLMERMSPKDRDGNIIEYSDPDTTAELYLATKEKSSSRAKELAGRSMTRSGTSQPSKLEEDATMRFLKENNII